MHKIFRLQIELLLLLILLVSAPVILLANSKGGKDPLAEEYLGKVLEFKAHHINKAFSYTDSLKILAEKLNSKEYLFEACKLKGDLYHQLGRHEEGFYWLNQAAGLAREIPDTLRIVKIYNNLGAIYHDSGNLDKALHNYTQAYLLGDRYLNLIQKATILSNVALVYGNLEQFKEAHHYYGKALELLEDEKGSFIYAYLHANLGNLYIKQNKKEKALSHFRIARKCYEKLGDETGLAASFNGFANILNKENPEVSLDYLFLAQKIYEKQKDKIGLFYIHKSAGEAYLNLKDYSNALNRFEQAVALSDSLNNTEIKAGLFLKIAHLYDQQQLYDKSSLYFKRYIDLENEKDKSELNQSIASSMLDYEIGIKENKIKLLEEETQQVYSLLKSRNLTISIMVGLAVLFFFMGFFYVAKYRKLDKLNSVLLTRNKLIQTQKAEIQDQHRLIRKKQSELEKAQKISDEYFAELLTIKEQLEEKVKDRTRELEGTYKKLSFHINNTPLAILEWNSQLELIRWPKQAEQIFGYSTQEVLGLRMDEVPFIGKDDQQESEEIIKQLCNGEMPIQYFTKRSTGRYGNPLYIEWSYSVLLDGEGKPESIITIANDVTIREQTFKELKSANEELDTFLYKSSHDLRGPLARMQGIINLGLLESTDPQAIQYFNMLKKVTDELNTLLLRLMSVHNINQHEFKIEELNFARFVDETIELLGSSNHFGHEIAIVNKVPKDFYLLSDFSLIRIILFNLLENGYRFADNFNPRIEVEALYLPSGKYIISVTDNGMGIPEEFKEKIFDMFFQGSTRSTGTGLGLFMVKKAVKKLRGEIRLYSENGLTVFEIVLPAARAVQKPKLKVLN